ncbi:TPA: hypothetical protein R1R37_002632 [Klebsiella aerogenes]|nr:MULTISPECIES: hypothetical protein [Klebsiella]HBQ5831400.1 hypothetical protein [Klebsiella pneumoniae subsp. pneumoniae]HBR1074687.1 hypothetical protein [Klebsiella quasipneumoniae subsp. quasipneumoniae]ART02967.1 hypothetical protein B8O09_22700 [Klebsiella pneumoniae]ASC25985.1 hypothetical protein AM386_16260 [Klebsiella pneumoniae]ATR44845.1 hypothetical protein CTI63_07150 [Klebsiella pneumoniae]
MKLVVVNNQDLGSSADEIKLNSVKIAVINLIAFVIRSFDQHGMDMLSKIVDPSLEELEEIITELEKEAQQHDDINLKQALLLSQMLINDIRQKNPELCAQSSTMLSNLQIF